MINYKNGIILLALAIVTGNANGTNIGDLRKNIGLKQFWEVPLEYRPEITVIILDNFAKSSETSAAGKDRELTHGERVAYLARAMNPRAIFIEIQRNGKISQELLSTRTIINMSYGRGRLEREIPVGFPPELIKAAYEGAILVKSAGNDAEIFGLSKNSKMLAEEAAKINQDPKARGAIIIAGAGDPIIEGSTQYNSRYGFISEYSAIAGEAKDSYVFVNTSLLTIKTRELADGRADFKKVNGTSFAAPVISAILSLLWMHFPNATGKEIANMVFNSARLPREIPANIYIWLSQRTNKNVSFWKKILSPEDVYGRGSVNAMLAYERGEANNNPQPEKLNTQGLRAQLEGVTLDYQVHVERSIFRKFMGQEMIDKNDLDLLHDNNVIFDKFLKKLFNSIKPGQTKAQMFEEQPYFALHYAFYILNQNKEMAELAARSASKYFANNRNNKDDLRVMLRGGAWENGAIYEKGILYDRWSGFSEQDKAAVKTILRILTLTDDEIENLYNNAILAHETWASGA